MRLGLGLSLAKRKLEYEVLSEAWGENLVPPMAPREQNMGTRSFRGSRKKPELGLECPSNVNTLAQCSRSIRTRMLAIEWDPWRLGFPQPAPSGEQVPPAPAGLETEIQGSVIQDTIVNIRVVLDMRSDGVLGYPSTSAPSNCQVIVPDSVVPVLADKPVLSTQYSVLVLVRGYLTIVLLLPPVQL